MEIQLQLNEICLDGASERQAGGSRTWVRLARILLLGLSALTMTAVYADPPLSMTPIITPANATVCEHDYAKAAATVQIKERSSSTDVKIKLYHGKPNHLYTVWYKLNGSSPLTGAAATPAAPTSEIDNIIDIADTAAPGANAFYTNSAGNGTLHIELDFPLSNGVYPFSQYDGSISDVATGQTPFTFRVISHCLDFVQHGLSPGLHEPTFQISLKNPTETRIAMTMVE